MYIKCLAKTIAFGIWMKSTITPVRKKTCTFLYLQKGTKMFIKNIQKKDTFPKARQLPLRFYIPRAWQFSLCDFSWKCWCWHLYKKARQFSLREFFIYKTRDTSQKAIQFALRLYIQKFLKLCVLWFFIELLKFSEWGETFLY